MRHRGRSRVGLMLLVALCGAGCASVTSTVPIVRPTGAVVTRLADLNLPRGTDAVVRLVSGETLRGTVEAMTDDRLELRARDATGDVTPRTVYHGEIALVARVVKMSKGARGCLGAAIGALVSVPFGISMVGDMMVPAAIAGALIGRRTGDSRATVVFERPCDPGAGTAASGQRCPIR